MISLSVKTDGSESSLDVQDTTVFQYDDLCVCIFFFELSDNILFCFLRNVQCDSTVYVYIQNVYIVGYVNRIFKTPCHHPYNSGVSFYISYHFGSQFTAVETCQDVRSKLYICLFATLIHIKHVY